MYFSQHYLDCLSQASYLIGDETTGQAVVVDPRRDIADYLSDAADHGLRIIGVINTHFHADFLSGHLEMAQATGAWIGYGQGAHAEFQIRSLADGERITLGEVTLEIMHTPGHTPESISVLVYEHPDDDIAHGVLTGDALFIGDVGRPDLLASIGVTADELGHQLYDSIQRKLMGLPDAVRVFPAHGAGSACGKNLSTEKQSTIGEQRLFNYACQPMNEADFVALVTAGQPLAALGTAEMLTAISGGALVVDARDAQDFAAGHLTGALNVPADGRFAETAGMILQPADEVVVMAPDGRAQEVAVRLARIGFDQVTGYVPDGETILAAHPELTSRGSRLTPRQLAEASTSPNAPLVIDVRNGAERDAGFIPGSLHIPLAQLHQRIQEIPADRPVVTYCAGGWRSSVAASMLRRHGNPDVSDLLGGFAAWTATHQPANA